MESILQLYYIGLLITDIELMLGNSYRRLRETIIHNGIFIYFGEIECQLRADLSSFPVQKKKSD